MRRIVFTALALVASAGAACSDAGESPTGSEIPAAGDASFAGIAESEIVASGFVDALTEEERLRLREAFARARADLNEVRRRLRAGEILPAEARREARAIHEALLEELAQFLDPELLERLQDHRPHRPGRPDLDLDEEQRAEIHAIWEALHAELAEIRRSYRDGELDADEARAEARQAVARAHEAVCAVLDETQAAAVPFCVG